MKFRRKMRRQRIEVGRSVPDVSASNEIFQISDSAGAKTLFAEMYGYDFRHIRNKDNHLIALLQISIVIAGKSFDACLLAKRVFPYYLCRIHSYGGVGD